MKIFFAGFVTGGNLWKEDKIRLLTGGILSKETINENIPCRRSSVEGGQDRLYDKATAQHKPYILESFYYADADTERLLPYYGDFLLDSGAFTFMQSNKSHVNWEEYIERYANFINRNKVEKFFELDIDSVVGYNKVLEYRKRLEKLTNKQCIPVWHKNRGIVEFKKMCDEYNYIAIGGFVAKEILKKEYKNIPPLIEYAHKKKCKIHGLGFTSTSFYDTIRFDSVDSTTWTIGGRMGNACYFNGQGMRQYYPSLNGKKPININKLTRHNYSEWIKFQKWAERNL